MNEHRLRAWQRGGLCAHFMALPGYGDGRQLCTARARFHVACTCVHANVHFHLVSNRLFVSPEKKEKEIRM